MQRGAPGVPAPREGGSGMSPGVNGRLPDVSGRLLGAPSKSS